MQETMQTLATTVQSVPPGLVLAQPVLDAHAQLLLPAGAPVTSSMQLTPEAIRRSVRELPALPAVVLELIQSLGDSEVSAEQLAAKISQDQAIAAKTLRLANSSFYRLPRQVTSIAEATTILGLRTLRSVATAAGLAGGFAHSRCEGFDFDAFWRHSIGTALTAHAIAQRTRQDVDAAFTLGLLHDIGRLVLISAYPAEYAQ